MTQRSLTAAEARRFARHWLTAWSGNDPELLASLYSDDAQYLEPRVPGGIAGKAALPGYFRKRRAHDPDWTWSQLEAIPMQGGFLDKWLARIPVGAETLEIIGVWLVQPDVAGRIVRNEVYFDRSPRLAPITAQPPAWR